MPASATHISDAGLDLIKEFEGFPYQGAPYWDRYGRVWTQGYGNTHGVTRTSPPITQARALSDLRGLMATRYEPAVRAVAKEVGGLTQPQWDALCSVVWNLGPGIIGSGSTLGRLLRAKQWRAFASKLTEFCRANGQVLAGLLRRRRAEASLFLKAAHADALDGYTASERRWIREYDALRRAGKDPERQRVLRRVMGDQRKRVWRAAQAPGGWQKANRAARYRSLHARST